MSTKSKIRKSNINSYKIPGALSGDPTSFKANTSKIETARTPKTRLHPKTVDAIKVPCPLFWMEQTRRIRHVSSGVAVAKELRTALDRAEIQIKALSIGGYDATLGLNHEGVFFSKSVDEESRELFPKLYPYIRCVQEILEDEIERLQKALDSDKVLRKLENLLCEDSELNDGSVDVVELVHETGFSYRDVVDIVNNHVDATVDRIRLRDSDCSTNFE